jgi:cytochrome c
MSDTIAFGTWFAIRPITKVPAQQKVFNPEEQMHHPRRNLTSLALFAAAFALSLSGRAFAVDADAAKMLARQNGCFKCHTIEDNPDKKKDGPPWSKVAAKMRGKADAEQKLIHHITSGEMAKFPDGHSEEHKIIKTKDMDQIKNLIDWILSL